MARERSCLDKKVSVGQELCLVLGGILKLDMGVSKDLSMYRARYDYMLSNMLEINSCRFELLNL